MSFATILGFLSLKKKSGKLAMVGLAATAVLAVWGSAKWDDWKIGRLERDNQALEVESQTAGKAAEDAVAESAITEQTIVEVDREKKATADEDAIRKEQVRNDVRKLQEELARLEAQRRAKERELVELDTAGRERDRGTDSNANPAPPEQRAAPPPTREVVVSRPAKSIDDRVAERILDGMWDNYCSEVADRRCSTQ